MEAQSIMDEGAATDGAAAETESEKVVTSPDEPAATPDPSVFDSELEFNYEVSQSSSGDFWLPEFALSPADSHGSFAAPNYRRGRWMKKSECVAMLGPFGQPKDAGMSVQVMQSIVAIPPHCQCPVCSYVQQATLVTKRQGTLTDMQMVSHGRDKITMYDKARPWQRHHEQQCTNPWLLDRRMPEIRVSPDEPMNKVYRMKMVPPGKVIIDRKRVTKNKETIQEQRRLSRPSVMVLKGQRRVKNHGIS